MEDLCSEGGIRELDFQFGSELYKERFGNRKAFESRIHVFGLNARGLAVNIMRLSAAVLQRSIRELLERSNLFDKLKAVWRAQLKKRQLPAGSADAK